MSINKLRQL